MCFSIPCKVLKIANNHAVIEGNKTVRLDKKLNITKGDYVRIVGDIIVDKLTKEEGLKIRRLIKSLN